MVQYDDGPWLVTGAAGFVGAHLCRRLLDAGADVVGVDNLNDYYDPRIKQARLDHLVRGGESDAGAAGKRFVFHHADMGDRERFQRLVESTRPAAIVHLAAQAGVRYSIDHPETYIDSNLVGFASALEAARNAHAAGHLQHFVYASSSSVYGGSRRLPFDVADPYAAGHPHSLYAATKRANELMAHSYSHLYGLPCTGLRFFTVYGPWGRPDMAYWKFTEAIVEGREIPIYGPGTAVRDFTYIDDIVEALVRVTASPAEPDPGFDPADPDPSTSDAPWRVFNIGHGGQATVNELIDIVEEYVGRPAERSYGPESPGDVPATHASTEALSRAIDYTPSVGLRDGLREFVGWFVDWHAARSAPVGATSHGAGGQR
jgi:UDP-glucuronate 4-epimerase